MNMVAFNLMQEMKKYSGIIVMVRAANHSDTEIASLKCPVVSFQGCKVSFWRLKSARTLWKKHSKQSELDIVQDIKEIIKSMSTSLCILLLRIWWVKTSGAIPIWWGDHSWCWRTWNASIFLPWEFLEEPEEQERQVALNELFTRGDSQKIVPCVMALSVVSNKGRIMSTYSASRLKSPTCLQYQFNHLYQYVRRGDKVLDRTCFNGKSRAFSCESLIGRIND